MSDETYEGWTNRETWALQLWLTNDQGLYEMTRERVADYLAAEEMPGWADTPDELQRQRIWTAGEAVRGLWEALIDPDEGLMTAENILSMVRDVGSEYRVDWDSIGRHWLEDVTENPVES